MRRRPQKIRKGEVADDNVRITAMWHLGDGTAQHQQGLSFGFWDRAYDAYENKVAELLLEKRGTVLTKKSHKSRLMVEKLARRNDVELENFPELG